jgi:tetratricopeptide (TPR) repeat protein
MRRVILKSLLIFLLTSAAVSESSSATVCRDRVSCNPKFETIFDKNPRADATGVFEVISIADVSVHAGRFAIPKGAPPVSTKNKNAYIFSYERGTVSIKDWIDYLLSIKKKYGSIGRLTIYAHGDDGYIALVKDSQILTLFDLRSNAEIKNQIERLKKEAILAPNANILLFSCRVGRNEEFIQELADITGAQVHANKEDTGYDYSKVVKGLINFKETPQDWRLEVVKKPQIAESPQFEDPHDKATTFLLECVGQKDLAKCDMAISEFNKAIKADPKHAWSYLNRGDAYRFKGDKAKAMGDYNKAISINPKFGNAYYYRGNLYFQSKDYVRAIQDYTKAIDSGYAGVRVYHARGDSYANLKDWGNAIKDYSEAINLEPEPDNALFYALRGFAYEEAGRQRQAFNDYSKSISLGHNEAAVYFRRGMLRPILREGYLEETVEDFNKAISLNTALAPISYLSLGILYDGVGKVDIARDYFNKTIAVDPNGDIGKKAKEYLKKMR